MMLLRCRPTNWGCNERRQLHLKFSISFFACGNPHPGLIIKSFLTRLWYFVGTDCWVCVILYVSFITLSWRHLLTWSRLLSRLRLFGVKKLPFGHLEPNNWYVSLRTMYVLLVQQDLLSKELYSCGSIHLHNFLALGLSSVWIGENFRFDIRSWNALCLRQLL